jgi:hypothetical protein
MSPEIAPCFNAKGERLLNLQKYPANYRGCLYICTILCSAIFHLLTWNMSISVFVVLLTFTIWTHGINPSYHHTGTGSWIWSDCWWGERVGVVTIMKFSLVEVCQQMCSEHSRPMRLYGFPRIHTEGLVLPVLRHILEDGTLQILGSYSSAPWIQCLHINS